MCIFDPILTSLFFAYPAFKADMKGAKELYLYLRMLKIILKNEIILFFFRFRDIPPMSCKRTALEKYRS